MNKLIFLKLYYNYLEDLSTYTDAQVGRLVRGMLRYAVFGELPEFRGGEKYIWGMLQSQIDRDKEHYQRVSLACQANGRKGGRPKNQTVSQKSERFSAKAKKAMIMINDNDNDEENDNENEKDKDKEKEYDQDKDFNPLKPPCTAEKPTLDEVRAYVREQDCMYFTAEEFYDYYSAIDWMMGGAPITNWKAVVRNWIRRRTPLMDQFEQTDPISFSDAGNLESS